MAAMLSEDAYAEVIERRRSLRIDGYATLADVDFNGEWVTPLQMAASSRSGPVLIAFNWLDVQAVQDHKVILRERGYLPSIPFNIVLDQALALRGLVRGDVYMTQAFHLLPRRRSGSIPAAQIQRSFDAVTAHEIAGRPVVALGIAAAAACLRAGVAHHPAPHPSARGLSYDARAELISQAIRNAGY